MNFGGFGTVWLLVMFDLPTDTKQARKDYQNFRWNLLNDGFAMLQFSVYARYCPSDENAEVHEKRLMRWLPPDGEVRIVKVTDKQYERMQIFYGKIRKATEKPPEQISFF